MNSLDYKENFLLYLSRKSIYLSSLFYKSASLLVLLVCIYSCSPSLNKQFKNAEVFENAFTGFAVYDLKNERMLYEYNSDKYFTPASNIKLLTLYAGLKNLGDSIATFKYKILNDSLIFTATGDPTFLNMKFDSSNTLNFLQNNDLELYYVKSKWQDKAFGPGWAWDDYNNAFSAERSAFPIYGNLVNFKFNKSNRTFTVYPESFKDSIKITEKEKDIYREIDGNTFSFGASSSKNYSKLIPFKTSEKISVQLLSEKLNKKVVYLEDEKLLSELNNEFYSIPADSLYKEMLFESDNFIAEQILLMVSQKISDTLNTEIAISQTQKNDFEDLPDEIFWVDGSGLSRYNLAAPRSIVKILKKIIDLEGQKKLSKILPEAGKEGTIKNFLLDKNAIVYAKSGSMRNNYSLSGLLITKKGKRLLFSFMNSNYTVSSKKLKAEMEQVLLRVINKY